MEQRPQSRVKEPAQTPSARYHPSMPVTEQFQQFLSQCDEQALMGLLRTLQVRLGTPREAADDIDRATAVMHQLNNLRTIRVMSRDVCPPENRQSVSENL